MPRRLSKNTRAWVYSYLALRYGERCNDCGREPPLTPLDIDHINGDSEDWERDNLQLLCRTCNTTKENKARARLRKIQGAPTLDGIESPGVGTEERERAPDNPTTRIIKEAVDYQTGSAEMRANHHFEGAFRSWVLATVREQGHLLKEEAINAGAELVGCNPTTARKYLAKLTSSAGPLREGTDMLMATVLVMREPPARPRATAVDKKDPGSTAEGPASPQEPPGGVQPSEPASPQEPPGGPQPSEPASPQEPPGGVQPSEPASPQEPPGGVQPSEPASPGEAPRRPQAPQAPQPITPAYITGGHPPCPNCGSTDRWVAPLRTYDNTCTNCGPRRPQPSRPPHQSWRGRTVP